MKQPKKSKKKVVVVKSKDDPRYQAYQDSLSLYTYNKLQRNLEPYVDIRKELKAKSPISRLFESKEDEIKREERDKERKKNQKILFQEAKKRVEASPNIKFGTYNPTIRPSLDIPIRGGATETITLEEAYKRAGGSWDIHSDNIKPEGEWFGAARNEDYSNVKPNQKVVIEDGVNNTPIHRKTIKPYIQPRNIGKPLELPKKGINTNSETPKGDVPITNPKYWEVEQHVNQNSGSNVTKRRVTNRKELEKLQKKQEIDESTSTGKNNKLIVKPIYKENEMKRKRRKVIPKKFIGGLISVAGMANSLVQQGKNNREQEEAQKQAIALNRQSNLQEDVYALEDFNADGNMDTSYYAEKGGKIARPSYATKGGDLKSLSSDMEIAKGNKHNESSIDNTTGIKLYGKDNQPFAEVEDDETIKDGNKVYSDKLKFTNNKTYADNAEILAKKKAKVEKNLADNGDSISRNTNERRMEILDKEEDALFAHQEMSKKGTTNTVEFAEGGKFAKFMDDAAPFIDNIGNALLTANTPEIPDVLVERQKKLPTTFNANPQLNAITRSVEAGSKNIKNNTSNSAVARNETTALRLRGAEAKSRIYANKENQENSMKANSINANAAITARNTANINAQNMKEVARQGEIQSRTSANFKNLAEDFIEKRDFEAKENYQNRQIDLLEKTYDVDGTSRRAVLNDSYTIEELQADPIKAQRYLEKFKGTPEEAKLRELLKLNRTAGVGAYANIN